mmetsp:Transcript_21508/g.54576  ORF Transcript_21508/g.54576 Transcript_21508/m.54576 type:complete len:501 (-) Transcript_21508:252-1754(-)
MHTARVSLVIVAAIVARGASGMVATPARVARAGLRSRSAMRMVATTTTTPGAITPDAITVDQPLRVLVAGGGVGGLMVAKALRQFAGDRVEVTVLERVRDFKLFGGPIQLASNALETIKTVDLELYNKIEAVATFTGDRTCGIKDGIRSEWYAKFDLLTPAASRGMPPTCVVARPDLQAIFLEDLGECVRCGAGVASYERDGVTGVTAIMNDGSKVRGDVLIGADGIWSSVRAKMYGEPMVRGPGATAQYSGYAVFAAETFCDPPDRKETGYKVYIGPEQYFVISDIGGGQMQWYAFVALPEGFIPPTDMLSYIKNRFTKWSPEIHYVLDATKIEEVEQRDLYDRKPMVLRSWVDGPVTLLGDAIHAMMPNLGQGGCQAIEDAHVIAQELSVITSRAEVPNALRRYWGRRLIRSATVQGLSRFASDIIIRGFDTPCKISFTPEFKMENFNYAGVVTRILQPILPIFFWVQFNFLYSGWKNNPVLPESFPPTPGLETDMLD